MDEKELIRKTLQGDENAFAALMLENKERVYRHCLSLLKDENLAEDLTQEAFLHAYQHLNTFRMQASFSTWLWRIAHNLSLNYLKKHKRLETEFQEKILVPSAPKTEEENEELKQKLKEAVSHLPLKQRVVFEMYEIERIPQKQIATKLGIAHGTVRSRLYYARKALRHFLNPLPN